MRHSILLPFLLLSAACSSVGPLELRDTPTLTLGELRQQPAQFGERIKAGEAVVVHVKAGEEVPLLVSVDIPGLTFLPGQNRVRFERDVYVHYGAGSMHISADGETWAAVGDFRGMARLFGLGHGGTFQVGAGVNATDGPMVSVKVGAK